MTRIWLQHKGKRARDLGPRALFSMRDDSRPADLPHLRSIDPSSLTGQFKPDHDNAPTVQLAAMFRRVGKVAEKFKIRATPEEVGIEGACGRGLIPAIDARITVRPKPPGGFPKQFI